MLGDANKLFVLKVCWHCQLDNDQHCFAFTRQANIPAHNLNFHWRWWDWIQDTLKNLCCFTIHECTDAMCDVKFSFLEKLSLQREHWYSFFLSWADAIWHLILCVDEKLALQIEHLWGFIPWWTMAMWFFNLGRRAKLEPHKSHINGFFPSCTDNMCIFRVPYNGRY